MIVYVIVHLKPNKNDNGKLQFDLFIKFYLCLYGFKALFQRLFLITIF